MRFTTGATAPVAFSGTAPAIARHAAPRAGTIAPIHTKKTAA